MHPNEHNISVDLGGLAKAVHQDEKNHKEYQWLETGGRNFDVAYRERITQPMNNGLLVVRKPDGSIKFDDRKLRFSGITSIGDSITIYVAPTTFGEMVRSGVKALNDHHFFSMLTRQGMQDFGDPWAYFAMIFSFSAVPVTEDGYAHVFMRGSKSEMYKEHWHVIGGIDTNHDLFHDEYPSHRFLEMIREGVTRELVQETGSKDVRVELTGLVRNGPISYEFTHIAYVPGSSRDLLQRIGHAEDAAEHTGDFKLFKDRDEIMNFLWTEPKIVPGGYGSLFLYANRQK